MLSFREHAHILELEVKRTIVRFLPRTLERFKPGAQIPVGQKPLESISSTQEAVADNRTLITNGALRQADLVAVSSPVAFELVRRGRK